MVNIDMISNKISIIVPVYNCEKYLEKLINSVTNQQYKNYELILVDDGSTDNSLEIMNKYAKKNEKIKVFKKKNEGPRIDKKIWV